MTEEGLETVTSVNRKKRDSNFELLRILAMFMVILQHISVYGGWPTSLEHTFSLEPNSFFIQFIYHFGKIGVWIFVLISGYYMINSKSSIIPKFLKLWLQVLSISVLIDVIFILSGETSTDSIDWSTDLFPIMSGDWWFASTYLIVLPFTPYINKMLKTLKKREHLTLILLMLLMWSIIPTFTHSSMYGSFIMMFVAMYVIGAYIRLYPESFEKGAMFYGLCTILSILILAGLIALIDLLGPIYGFKPFESALSWGNEKSIMVVLISTLTFLTFKQINIGHIGWINLIASTTFGVYLIHEHDLFRQWMFGLLDMGTHYYSPDLVPFILVCMLGIFAFCSALEFVRMQTIDRLTSKLIPGMSRLLHKIQYRITDDRGE